MSLPPLENSINSNTDTLLNIMIIVKEDKLRLYLAFSQPNELEGGREYCTTLLLVPKKPDTSMSEKGTYQYHVDFPPPKFAEPKVKVEMVRNRTPELLSLTLLGKFTKAASRDLQNRLAAVAVPELPKNGKWSCRDWALSAITALLDYRMIDALSQGETARSLWDRQNIATNTHYAQKQTMFLEESVPTFNVKGKQIGSEIGPMPGASVEWICSWSDLDDEPFDPGHNYLGP